MLKFYRTTEVEKKIKKTKKVTEDCWIDLIMPTPEEIDQVVSITNIDRSLITKMLDEEETPRIEETDNATLIVIDTPYLEEGENAHFSYTTRPLGIIVTDTSYVITVAPNPTRTLTDFKTNKIKDFRTSKRTRFVIQILLKTAKSYLRALNVINRKIEYKEKILSRSTSNKDLIDMLDIEKTLVYFITSLKANDLVLEKLNKGTMLTLFEGDYDLLEDAIIENQQAIEMSGIYKDILSSITDTYATVVSNNLNMVMKFLAGTTIILSIPTMIFSYLGMNVDLGVIGSFKYSNLVILLSSLLVTIIVAIILKIKKIL